MLSGSGRKRWRWRSARGWLSGTGKRRYRVSGITKNTWSVQRDWVRTAALSHSPRFLLITSVLNQKEVPATVSSFYVSVLYTTMLRTSIAAVLLGCFYFCSSDCDIPVMVVDCAAVETGCTLEKYKMVAHLQCYNERGYIRTWYVYKMYFSLSVRRDIPTTAFFHSWAFCFRVNRLRN